MAERAHILPGTLDLLILKAVSLGPLYPAQHRLAAAIAAALETRPEER